MGKSFRVGSLSLNVRALEQREESTPAVSPREMPHLDEYALQALERTPLKGRVTHLKDRTGDFKLPALDLGIVAKAEPSPRSEKISFCVPVLRLIDDEGISIPSDEERGFRELLTLQMREGIGSNRIGEGRSYSYFLRSRMFTSRWSC